MSERHGSSIRTDRFLAFESPPRGDGNTASEPGRLPDRATLFMGSGAGPAEKADEGHVPQPTLRAGVPPAAYSARGEAS